MKIETIQLYEERKDVTLTAYILDKSSELAVSPKRPAVIINPGGAYIMLSDREAEPIAMKFAGMGFQTFVLRYSVANGGKNTWPENMRNLPPENKGAEYPAPLLELGKSMLKIKENADKWHVDPDQIGICGFSAGGHNCTLYASSWFREVLTEGLHTTEEKLRPLFCIAGYPFVDWELEYNLDLDEDMRTAYRWMYYDYFGDADPSPERMRACSPNYLVTEKTAQTFIWTTMTDKSVDPRHSMRLAEAMVRHQVPCELHIFGEGHHGLALADRATLQNSDDLNDTVAQWIPLVEQWLKKVVNFSNQKNI